MVGNKNRLPAPYQKDWDNLFFGYADTNRKFQDSPWIPFFLSSNTIYLK